MVCIEMEYRMRIYIDTEFNDFRGDLISMALVAEDGTEFYEVLECANPSSWVAQHVMTCLLKEPIPINIFQHRLYMFLHRYNYIHLIADWPDDIHHFCEALITGPGECLNFPTIVMEMRRDLSSDNSAVPHNALHDARAIAQQDKGQQTMRNNNAS